MCVHFHLSLTKAFMKSSGQTLSSFYGVEPKVERIECLFSFTGFFGRIHGITHVKFVEGKSLCRYCCSQSHASLTWRSWNPEVCFLTSRAAGWFCFNRKIVFYWGLLEYQRNQVNTECLCIKGVCEIPLVSLWNTVSRGLGTTAAEQMTPDLGQWDSHFMEVVDCTGQKPPKSTVETACICSVECGA